MLTPESQLIAQLGVTAAQMRLFREKYPAEVTIGARKAVLWSENGVAFIRADLVQKEPAPPLENHPIVATVLKHTLNRHTIIAKNDAGQKITVTGIRDNQLLVPRQKIRALLHGTRWVWHGPHPIRKGQPLVK